MEVLPAAAFTSYCESRNPFTPGDQFSWHGSSFILFSKAPEEPSKSMTVSFGLSGIVGNVGFRFFLNCTGTALCHFESSFQKSLFLLLEVVPPSSPMFITAVTHQD